MCYEKTTLRCISQGEAWKATEPLELEHSDVCGPMKIQILITNTFTFIDDYSRMCWAFFLRNKS